MFHCNSKDLPLLITVRTILFIKKLKKAHPGIDPAKPFYMQKLQTTLYDHSAVHLDLDAEHLKEWDPVFYRQLVSYPSEMIPIFDMATNELFYSKVAMKDEVLDHQIQVYFSRILLPPGLYSNNEFLLFFSLILFVNL